MDRPTSKFLLGLLVASTVLLGAGVALVVDIFFNVPDFKEMRNKVLIPIKLANKEKSKKEIGPKAPGWVSFNQISNHAVMAVIASEDTSFFSHEGVDYHELREAIKKDWEEKKFARGGSTLTQQVVKNVYLGQQKTLWRKLKEFFWAREIEKVLSKQEILCFYMNMAEWGPGIYGIREAAQHYFGVSPGLMTAKQSAFLALLLPSPVKFHSYYSRKELTAFASKRISQILRIMYRMGFVDGSGYEIALAEPLWGRTGVIQSTGAPGENQVEELIPEDPLDFSSEIANPLQPPTKNAPAPETVDTAPIPQPEIPLPEPPIEELETSPLDTTPTQ